jgi:integrase
MTRTTDDAKITTRADRDRLPPRHEPYWRSIDGKTLSLGYRKGPQGGVWIARLREDGAYRKLVLGRTDDTLPATVGKGEKLGVHETAPVIDFRQAQAKATEWADHKLRVTAGLEAARSATPAKPYTVADALADYLADYTARGGKALVQTRNAIAAHIAPALGQELVARLTRDKLRRWHRALATAPARLRAAKGKVNLREPYDDADDAQRRRRATANRVLTILKATLNHARREGLVSCPDDAWASVLPFKEADAPKVRYLTDAETTRLINACAGDFRDLVLAALLTGCRYGELMKLKAGDFDRQAGTLLVQVSKGGKPRHIVLTDEGRAHFGRLAAGSLGADLMLTREAIAKQATKQNPAVMMRVAWSDADQHRPIKEACAVAKIVPAISFHILRHCYASRLAMRGVSLPVIAAQLGHKDTRMTERHYAHLAPSYVADVVRGAFGSLGVALPTSNVTPIVKASA